GQRLGGPRWVAAWAWAGATAVAAVLVGAVLAAQLVIPVLRGTGGAATASPTASAGSEPAGEIPADMGGWAAAAAESIWQHLDRPGLRPEMPLVRLERCGDTALAFYAVDPTAAAPFVFGLGDYRSEPFEAGFGGVASSVDEPEAGYARTQREPCVVELDLAPRPAAVLAAYLATDPQVTDATVLATKLVTLDVALAYVHEVREDRPHQQVLVLRRDGDGWAVTGAQGGDLPVLPAAAGVTPLGTAKGMPDDRPAAVGRTDDERVVAVELDFDGFPHRYPVQDGAFVVQLPPGTGFALSYRLLDADGTVVSAGVSQP
ncbi:MAG: hypothetical protein ACRDHD_08240, partial [Candidatus Limnocylindria bacterium]